MSSPQWSTLFIKGFTVIDSSFASKTRGLVGESWLVDITLKGTLNDESMIFDFGLVKKHIKSIIDEVADHKLIIPATCSGIEVVRENDTTSVTADFDNENNFVVKAPENAFYFIDEDEVSASCIQVDLERKILAKMPANVTEVSIVLRTEALGDAPYYHYSHGLKKHQGNCQRIVHGHRSKIEIYEDGVRSDSLQRHWEKRWQDIYLVSEEDINGYQSWQHTEVENQTFIHSSYSSSEGDFELLVHKSKCEVIPTDTTVEFLAEYIAHESLKKSQCSRLEVFAYEGIEKGAYVELTQ
ncbi:hypothetical protein CS022_06525 [Veronia nyctiphanis]|uniref:6-carboxy-5,6,7,8-tetrahydropterin synthase n=1 Tax=Veronia nyctiphanis TaxID=1278244 RepID=A0A4Q0YRZ1_9GAMM|nr:6-carboxytetrahydropterin synthase [Veronia nyctiphanis]RXJ73932.1 hypothetical protein CS022_06525 [Veronia nyctiphanis]